MYAAKIFENGGSQAVRLPKDCRFQAKEIMTHKIGDIVLLMPKEKAESWSGLLAGLELFDDDFMAEGRRQSPPQEREAL